LTNERFDVGIAEMYDYCPSALFHKLGVRTKIKVTAIHLIQMVSRKFDIPSFASFMPSQILLIDLSFLSLLIVKIRNLEAPFTFRIIQII